jgi:hypothetical protein
MKIVGVLILMAVLFACKEDPKPTTSTADVAALRSQVEQMKVDAELKDSMINESLMFFNEIQDNLISIGVKEESVRTQSRNSELANNDRELVLNEIRQINLLREENAKKIAQLQSSMKSSGLRIVELEAMVKNLLNDIAQKDEQIKVLQVELENKDKDYARLFDAYQEKDYEIEVMTESINTAYYVYGSENELLNNGVVSRGKGYLGVGKKIRLKEDFNENYFTKIDKRNKKEFLISGSKIQLISTHPTSSYELKSSGTNTKLTIKDVVSFWKVSNYLIVVVD